MECGGEGGWGVVYDHVQRAAGSPLAARKRKASAELEAAAGRMTAMADHRRTRGLGVTEPKSGNSRGALRRTEAVNKLLAFAVCDLLGEKK